MRILIAGAGETGIALARYLRAENHEIVMIDKNPDALEGVSEQLDIQTLTGSCDSPLILERAGADSVDILLAMTGDDQSNIIACSLAKELFRVSKRIARVSSNDYLMPKYSNFLKALSVDVVVSPEVETANQILTALSINGATDMTILGRGLVRFLGLKCRSDIPLLGKTLSQLKRQLEELNISVVAVVRRHQLMDLKKVTLQVGDEVYFFVDTVHLPYSLDLFGCSEMSLDYVLMYGGGSVGFQTAKALENDSDDSQITLLERDKTRAGFLAEHLKRTLVIHGDGFDDTVLDDLDLRANQVSIATTQSDENNVLLSLIAKRAGVRRTCALVRNTLYKQYLRGLGVDILINPNAVMVSAVLQCLRKGRLQNDYFLQSGMGEVLEIEALKTSRITSLPFERLKIPNGVQIGGVLRKGKFIRLHKGFRVMEGDKVYVFVQRGQVARAEKLFTVRLAFFT